MGATRRPRQAPTEVSGRRNRPDHFSTYVPRSLVRSLKVVATIRDIPLWEVVTTALEEYLDVFQAKHGKLPTMDDRSDAERGGR